MHLIDRLADVDIGELEGGDHGQTHDLKAGENDETDALHAALHNVLKRRLYDI
jgi:hypothetical protein